MYKKVMEEAKDTVQELMSKIYKFIPTFGKCMYLATYVAI